MHFDLEVGCTLVEGCMGRSGNNTATYTIRDHTLRNFREYSHLRLRDTFCSPCPIPVSFDGHDDGLSSTRRRSSRAIRVVVHPKTHCYDFRFHLSDGREHVRMQRIRDAVAFERSDEDLAEVVSAVCKR